MFGPLGITNYKWDKLKDGYHDGGGLSLWMKTDDLAKIGQLVLNYGLKDNKEVVSREWISLLSDNENKQAAPWGLKGSCHGYCWYTATYKEYDVLYAMGYGGQFIFIFPELRAVVAVNHNHDTAEGIEQSGLFLDKYLPLIFDTIKE